MPHILCLSSDLGNRSLTIMFRRFSGLAASPRARRSARHPANAASAAPASALGTRCRPGHPQWLGTTSGAPASARSPGYVVEAVAEVGGASLVDVTTRQAEARAVQ